jgi:transcription elongation factor Elf1
MSTMKQRLRRRHGRVGRPHNYPDPIDMRKNPVCYLCGRHWRIETLSKSSEILIIQCSGCGLRSRAKIDEAVLQSREKVVDDGRL